MFVITITTDFDRDVENIKEILRYESEEGGIEREFDVKVDETSGEEE